MLPLGARARALFLCALLVGASAVLLGGDALSFSSGIDEARERDGGGQTTLVAGGCSCHNTAYTGTVTAVLEGIPSFYTFGGEAAAGPHELTIRILGGPNATAGRAQGGFNLQATQGTLSAPAGATDVQVLEGEATHTTAGNKQREWKVLWAPPAAAGPDAQFTLTVNAVNGDGAPLPPDAWGRATMVSMGATRLGAAAGGEEQSPVHQITTLGVNFYAYWVGVISFVVLFIVLAATFFLLRYGETHHWSDWRDRPARDKGDAAPKSALGTWIVLGLVLVLFVIAAVQVARLV